jgi:hypothetical protein
LHFWAAIVLPFATFRAGWANVPTLRCRRFRYPPGVRVFLEQLMFCLQPIIHIVSMSAASLKVDLICAQLDFFLCGMGFGSA